MFICSGCSYRSQYRSQCLWWNTRYSISSKICGLNVEKDEWWKTEDAACVNITAKLQLTLIKNQKLQDYMPIKYSGQTEPCTVTIVSFFMLIGQRLNKPALERLHLSFSFFDSPFSLSAMLCSRHPPREECSQRLLWRN